MSDHNAMKPPSLWRQEPDEVTLLLLGKLAEEASELAARCCRSIIQGLYSQDPDDNRTNLSHLKDEIADVTALIALFSDRVEVDAREIVKRRHVKYSHKDQWLDMVREAIEAKPTTEAPETQGGER